MTTKTKAWAWQNPDGTIQETTFQSCDAALLCMSKRTNAESYEAIQEMGFTLCRVEVTLQITSKLI